MFPRLLLASFLLVSRSTFLLATPTEAFFIDDIKALSYVEQYKHIAVAEMDRTGIPASIKMAQGILESGVGESDLASTANNHFGIKCGGEVWTGETHYVWDDEVVKSCFRVYGSAEESYVAHSEFLLNPKKAFRYGDLFKLERTDYKGWANGLQQSGYATSKTYSKNLISIIERLSLYKLDYLTVEVLALHPGELASLFPSTVPRLIFSLEDTTKATTRIPDPFGVPADSVDLVMTLYQFKINDLDAVYVQESDDINSIADRYRKNPKKLYRYNELQNRPLKVGQYLFLEKKAKAYRPNKNSKAPKVHILRQGQDLYEVAQLYGIRYRHLLRYNKVYRKQTPKAGVQIFLDKQH